MRRDVDKHELFVAALGSSAADAVAGRVYKRAEWVAALGGRDGDRAMDRLQSGGEESIMAGSVNKVILVGNLGKDPDVRRLNSGDQVVSFSVATSETWRDKASGERKERTEWHNVVIFNENLGKVAEQYCKKGTKVYLEGQLQTRKWQDQSGADRYTTEVVLQRFRGELQLLDSRGGGEGRDSFPEEGRSPQLGLQPRRGKRAPSGALWRRGRRGAGPIDDDIPF